MIGTNLNEGAAKFAFADPSPLNDPSLWKNYSNNFNTSGPSDLFNVFPTDMSKWKHNNLCIQKID